MNTQWLNPAEQAAWRAYVDGTRLLISTLNRQLEADAGLSFTDYEILVHLSEAPQRRLRMRDLADATLSTRSGATRAVSRLEEIGLVRRVACDDDRRGMNAELTEAGWRKLVDSAPGHVRAVREHCIDLLSADEIRTLQTIGSRVRDHVQDVGVLATTTAA